MCGGVCGGINGDSGGEVGGEVGGCEGYTDKGGIDFLNCAVLLVAMKPTRPTTAAVIPIASELQPNTFLTGCLFFAFGLIITFCSKGS